MGIDTGCMLIVGLMHDELLAGLSDEWKDKIEERGFRDVISEDGEMGLHYASPYYDSDVDVRPWGISVASIDWKPIELSGDWKQKIEDAHVKFKRLTGLDGKLYVSPHVT